VRLNDIPDGLSAAQLQNVSPSVCAQGYIECNDCDAVIRRVPADQLRQTLNEMEAGLDVASEQCPHYKSVNLFPAFSKMMVYTCRECGEVVRLCEGPEIDAIFGREED
jgi:hypothetical protein